MRELLIKKCKNCGAYVKVFKDCKCKNCGIVCCGESMEVLTPNSVDAAVEKHVPTYEVKDGKIRVEVNHVMEDEHYIEWIAFVNDEKSEFAYLKPGMDATVEFDDDKGTLYAYCNLHGLWKNEIK